MDTVVYTNITKPGFIYSDGYTLYRNTSMENL